MGIDIDMTWKGKTEEECREKELAIDRAAEELWKVWMSAGFRNVPGVGRTALGHVGYLYEAYNAAPFATPILVPEAFEAADHTAKIPAAAMRSRLAEAMAACRQRAKTFYGDDDTGALGKAMAKSLADFVALAERKEIETGGPVTITVS